jgi:hypothetical protein
MNRKQFNSQLLSQMAAGMQQMLTQAETAQEVFDNMQINRKATEVVMTVENGQKFIRTRTDEVRNWYYQADVHTVQNLLKDLQTLNTLGSASEGDDVALELAPELVPVIVKLSQIQLARLATRDLQDSLASNTLNEVFASAMGVDTDEERSVTEGMAGFPDRPDNYQVPCGTPGCCSASAA